MLLLLLIPLLPLITLLSGAPGTAPQEAARPDPVALGAELHKAGDDADPEQLRLLATSGTPTALEALMTIFDGLQSRYLQTVVLDSLPSFIGIPETEELALERLVGTATASEIAELRSAALEALARCGEPGRARLVAIVVSDADQPVRERALQLHVDDALPEDASWYQSIWRSKPAKTRGKSAGLYFGEVLRELAFEGIAPTLAEGALVAATEDDLPGVRRRAFALLAAGAGGKALKCAQRLYDDRDERPETRLAAAAFLLRQRGAKQATTLFDDATQMATPPEIAFGLADLLATVEDARFSRSVLKNLGQGQQQEKRVTLRTAAGIDDPKVDEALAELSKSPDPALVVDVVETMARRGKAVHLTRLRELLEPRSPAQVRAAVVEALATLEGQAEACARLRELAADPAEAVRNAALEQLARSGDAEVLEVLIEALGHERWSTRLTAARAIEALRLPEGVGALCLRLAHEQGRPAFEMSAILWRLTGQSLAGAQWAQWWKAEGASFRFPSAEELRSRSAERARREAQQISRSFRGVHVNSRFFGLRVKSHSVAFVVDVSLSMQEPLLGQTSEQAPTRMEIARRELLACMESLEPGTRFNILPFSLRVTAWKEKAVLLDETSFPEAAAFVEQLRPLDATNLYAALSKAFEDEQIDTIFLLSDGVPSGLLGSKTDPLEIRQTIERLNRHRGVVIHTIAIGERFPLLRWLADDTGGEYRTYP